MARKREHSTPGNNIRSGRQLKIWGFKEINKNFCNRNGFKVKLEKLSWTISMTYKHEGNAYSHISWSSKSPKLYYPFWARNHRLWAKPAINDLPGKVFGKKNQKWLNYVHSHFKHDVKTQGVFCYSCKKTDRITGRRAILITSTTLNEVTNQYACQQQLIDWGTQMIVM